MYFFINLLEKDEDYLDVRRCKTTQDNEIQQCNFMYTFIRAKTQDCRIFCRLSYSCIGPFFAIVTDCVLSYVVSRLNTFSLSTSAMYFQFLNDFVYILMKGISINHLL